MTARCWKKILKPPHSIFVISFMCLWIVLGCAETKMVKQTDVCSGYPNPAESKYVLPYPAGEAHEMIQGNCAHTEYPWTHYAGQKFAYDFAMPIGATIVAARAGAIAFVRDEFTDNDHGPDQGNAIVLVHEDGTVALYGHLTYKGSKVKVGQVVRQGEPIALSGNSGESPRPHLHFQVNACGDFSKCESLPIAFRNAIPNPGRLKKDASYTANP